MLRSLNISVLASILSASRCFQNPIFSENIVSLRGGAFYMVSMTRSGRITKEFELHSRLYAIDSTTIGLFMPVFRWDKFRITLLPSTRCMIRIIMSDSFVRPSLSGGRVSFPVNPSEKVTTYSRTRCSRR